MNPAIACDEELVRRLPLPLAQLYRHAHNAGTALDQHQAAYFLWEGALKLLASAAVVAYAERDEHDPRLAERLQNLARPALGHWWEFVRLLVPVLADGGDEGFRAARDLVLGRSRDDLPWAAGLDALLLQELEGRPGARTTVRVSELFDRLVRYRNRELGHGATGQRPADFYRRMGRALLAGVGELLGRLDVLAGRQLVYVAGVQQRPDGDWEVERYELAGEAPRRLEPLTRPRSEAARLPLKERVYLQGPAPTAGPVPALTPLDPLTAYDFESGEFFFLNARRGRRRSEYLCYSSGKTHERPDLGGEQRALLARVLDMPVDGGQVKDWEARSQAEEGPEAESAAPASHVLGEFELLSKLGRGGMGEVYRAWQPSLGRQVALKRLLGAGDPKAEARFAQEIRALGRVSHPRLVKIFTSGVEGDDWFYAMELVEGATLAAVCQQLQGKARTAADVDLQTWQATVSTACEETRKAERPLRGVTAVLPAAGPAAEEPAPPPPVGGTGYIGQVVELVRQVAEAAHALHEGGFVHRDIKPGNIMVTADGSQAVLMDLGLAQGVDRLTRTRQFVGTLRYASPQQVLAVERLDRRSDVYSLGATLWELLTLRPLFGATEEVPDVEVINRIQYAEPERVRKYNRGVPADLEAIVLKCLEKDPNRRYATAHKLAEDLARWQRGDPVRARRPTWGYRAEKLLRRRWRRLAIAGGLLGLLALAFGYGVLEVHPERTPVPLAPVLENERGQEPYGIHSPVTLTVNGRGHVPVEVIEGVTGHAAVTTEDLDFQANHTNTAAFGVGCRVSEPVKLKVTFSFPDQQVPLEDVTVQVNGEKESDPLPLEPAGVRELATPEVDAFFEAGNNVITVKANNPGELARVTVRLDWYADLAAKRDLYLFAVGVSDYQSPQLRLCCASKDAEDLARAFKGQEGGLFRKVHVQTMVDRQVVKAALLEQLEALKEQVPPDSLVLVTISGRGKWVRQTGRYLFLPYDFDPDTLVPQDRGVSWEDLQDCLTGFKCPVVLVLDSAQAGAANGTGLGGSATLNTEELKAMVDRAAEVFKGARSGIAVLAGAQGDEVGSESDKWGHGALTLALLEGIQGRYLYPEKREAPLPQGNPEGIITLDDLYDYAVRRVQELTRTEPTVQLRATDGLHPAQIPIAVKARANP